MVERRQLHPISRWSRNRECMSRQLHKTEPMTDATPTTIGHFGGGVSDCPRFSFFRRLPEANGNSVRVPSQSRWFPLTLTLETANHTKVWDAKLWVLDCHVLAPSRIARLPKGTRMTGLASHLFSSREPPCLEQLLRTASRVSRLPLAG